MNRTVALVICTLAVLFSAITLVLGATSGWLVATVGFIFVVGGTLLTAVVSESADRLESLFLSLPAVFKVHNPKLGHDKDILLNVAENYRRGRIRWADAYARKLVDPFLRQGAQLIVDGASAEDVSRALNWRISSIKEEEKRRLQIMHALAGFAPAFGMLGTLLGLAHMLFSLGDEGLTAVGASMGFALITTGYGLVAANLIIKPVAMKMEHRAREKLAWHNIKYELLVMLYGKEHPSYMQDTLQSLVLRQKEEMQSGVSSMSTMTGLLKAS